MATSLLNKMSAKAVPITLSMPMYKRPWLANVLFEITSRVPCCSVIIMLGAKMIKKDRLAISTLFR